jgi:hypothetical protein
MHMASTDRRYYPSICGVPPAIDTSLNEQAEALRWILPNDRSSTVDALDGFIKTFVGYGNLQAPLWFLGMEEGGGRDVAELRLRVSTWDERGRRATEDLAGFHRAIGVTKYFVEDRPTLQQTWCALMKALQAWRGGPTDLATLRNIQAKEFGSNDGPAALLELLPLPAQSIDSWPYQQLSTGAPQLASRSSYVDQVLPMRVQLLSQLVRRYRPTAVVCYGLGYTKHWDSIFKVALESAVVEGRRCLSGWLERTHVLVTPHPARANSTLLWTTIGLRLQGAARYEATSNTEEAFGRQ